MSVVSVYCIFGSADEAERIGRTVVEEGLAACINVLGPCRSVYRWQGEIQTAEEVPAILKTSAEAADALISRIAGLHSYDVPCIAVWPIDKLLLSYAEWVEQCVGPLGNA
jgi:periplasmic divalent cation tolerance protein